MKKIAILQSNYIPWKGYFDLIAFVDEFIIFDDMQFTRRDWRNRNQIKTPQGLQWLTIPVLVKGKFFQSIRHTKIDGKKWMTSHWNAICSNYSRSFHFHEIEEWLKPLYFNENYSHISDINRKFIIAICKYLNINTTISNSWDYKLVEGKTERLVELCTQASATEYVSGLSAKNYINEEVFLKKNIKMNWFNYDNYPKYNQLWGDFIHNVSILDLLFNCGKKSQQYMKFLK